MNLSGLPYLPEYFGIWAIESTRFDSMFSRAKTINLALHMESGKPEAVRAAASGESFQRNGSIAIIRIDGVMMKQSSSMEESTSTVEVRRKIRAAASNPDISGILLAIDSPGGTVSGTADLAADVREAAKKKPVYAHCEDLCASAAFWVASQATKFYAGQTALVGSIGTYSAVADFSKAAELEGIKVHVLRAGDFKGAGEPGTEVTAEQLANWQKSVDDLNEHFLKGVSYGRNMKLSDVRNIADGRVHIASTAKEMGLIDGVQSLDDTARQLSTFIRKGNSAMASTIILPEDIRQEAAAASPAAPAAPAKPSVATLAELKENCVGAGSDFLLAQLEAGATLPVAMKAWMAEQTKLLAAAKEEKPAATVTKPGVEPLSNSVSARAAHISGDPLAAFNDAVATKMSQGKKRHVAHAEVCREQPELREALIADHNAKFRKSA